MNSVNISGRLSADPSCALCRVARAFVSCAWPSRECPPSGETGYVNVSAFGKPGEAAARVLSKGWLVAVQGRLSYRAWEADDGSKRHDYEIVGNVEFLAAPRSNGAEVSGPTQAVVA
jgi:single-strand DNA-binding protein